MKHVVVRSEGEQRLASTAKVLGGIFAVAAAVLVIRELPSLIRYARMEMM